jgi:23S rRNA (cytidine2498-2'-O)-methyltransferase
MPPMQSRLYQPVRDFESHLLQELAGTSPQAVGPFYFSSPLAQGSVFWYQNCWLEPFRVEFASISEAASILRDIQRNWASALFTQFRRGALIAEQLPRISAKRRPFPWRVPASPMGAWTLLDAHTLLASAHCTSPFPNGSIEFEEDKTNPPSRAYLKLWEALVLSGSIPRGGEHCLDAGASPGGWTWVLAALGAKVTAIDRAPIDERLLALPNVTFVKHDAFTLKPEDIGAVDWLCCDVICYPRRLYEWIEKWLISGLCKNYICTIKMQGEPDFETTRRFAAISGSKVVHLCHNKHELTWMYSPTCESRRAAHRTTTSSL